MPYANNNGVKIYYEVEGEGPPVVLAHGAADNMRMWRRRGHVEALKNEYKLILLDARGHGRSDKPEESSAYGRIMAQDVLAVMDVLGHAKAHYCGYSMGAWIGYMLATGCPERFFSFILGGFAPYRDTKLATMDKEAAEGTRLLVSDPEAALLQRERTVGRPITEDERKRLLGIDAKSLTAVFGSMAAFRWFTPGELDGVAVPCLVYCGEVDPQYAVVKLSVKDMRKASFVSLPGLDHVTAFARSDLMLPHIKEFLATVSKT